jgi:hypothetical protein
MGSPTLSYALLFSTLPNLLLRDFFNSSMCGTSYFQSGTRHLVSVSLLHPSAFRLSVHLLCGNFFADHERILLHFAYFVTLLPFSNPFLFYFTILFYWVTRQSIISCLDYSYALHGLFTVSSMIMLMKEAYYCPVAEAVHSSSSVAIRRAVPYHESCIPHLKRSLFFYHPVD